MRVPYDSTAHEILTLVIDLDERGMYVDRDSLQNSVSWDRSEDAFKQAFLRLVREGHLAIDDVGLVWPGPLPPDFDTRSLVTEFFTLQETATVVELVKATGRARSTIQHTLYDMRKQGVVRYGDNEKWELI